MSDTEDWNSPEDAVYDDIEPKPHVCEHQWINYTAGTACAFCMITKAEYDAA